MNLQITGMKVCMTLLCFTSVGLSTSAQYYYNDILSTEANRKNFTTLQKEKIKKVSVKAYDTQGEIIDDFLLYQEVDGSKRTLTTYSKINISDASILETKYTVKGLPEFARDSAEGGSTRTSYQYNEKDQLVSMNSLSVESEQKENVVTEERKYVYNDSGIPESLVRIKGGTDTMHVTFISAENGLPGEEQWFKGNKKIETWYYYYDAQHRLTDIVRYNAVAKQLLPDYLFSYDDGGNIINKVTVLPGTGEFRIWQYRYDERGLKTQETVMNRQRKQEGKLVYEYQK